VLPPEQQISLLERLTAIFIDLCLLCDKTGRRNQIKLLVNRCGQMFHTRRLKLSKSDISIFRDSRYVFWQCNVPDYTDSLFDTSNEGDISQQHITVGSGHKPGMCLLSFNARNLKDSKKSMFYLLGYILLMHLLFL
jgi:hypothetical protein